jgi:hypothetical protein
VIGRDGVAGLVCLAGSLLLLGMTRGLPQPALVPIGPAFYPRILLVITAGLSAALVLSDLLRTTRRAAPAAGPISYRLVLITFAVFTGYVVLMPLLGFRASTLLFVGTLQAILDPPRGRRWARVGASALATTIVTYLVFERYLSVLLPRGSLTGF